MSKSDFAVLIICCKCKKHLNEKSYFWYKAKPHCAECVAKLKADLKKELDNG